MLGKAGKNCRLILTTLRNWIILITGSTLIAKNPQKVENKTCYTEWGVKVSPI